MENIDDVYNPRVPYSTGVHDLSRGSRINIRGTPLTGPALGFAVELFVGSHTVLRLNARFSDAPTGATLVLLEASEDGKSSHEERCKCPFDIGDQFMMQIKCNARTTKVKVNGAKMKILQCIPPKSITAIGINGDVAIHKIHFFNVERTSEACKPLAPEKKETVQQRPEGRQSAEEKRAGRALAAIRSLPSVNTTPVRNQTSQVEGLEHSLRAMAAIKSFPSLNTASKNQTSQIEGVEHFVDVLKQVQKQVTTLQTTIDNFAKRMETATTTTEEKSSLAEELLILLETSNTYAQKLTQIEKIDSPSNFEDDYQRSIVVFGVDEATGTNERERRQKDWQKTLDLLDELDAYGSPVKVSRMGKNENDKSKPRGLKVTFGTQEEATQVLSRESLLEHSTKFESVHIRPCFSAQIRRELAEKKQRNPGVFYVVCQDKVVERDSFKHHRLLDKQRLPRP